MAANPEYDTQGRRIVTSKEKTSMRRKLKKEGYVFVPRENEIEVPDVRARTINSAANKYGVREDLKQGFATTINQLKGYIGKEVIFDPYGDDNQAREKALWGHIKDDTYHTLTATLENDATRPSNMGTVQSSWEILSLQVQKVDPTLAESLNDHAETWEKRIQSVPKQTNEEKLGTVRALASDSAASLGEIFPNVRKVKRKTT